MAYHARAAMLVNLNLTSRRDRVTAAKLRDLLRTLEKQLAAAHRADARALAARALAD